MSMCCKGVISVLVLYDIRKAKVNDALKSFSLFVFGDSQEDHQKMNAWVT